MANEKELIPLYYAIIKHFLDGTEACADDVVTAELRRLQAAHSQRR